MRFHLTSCHDTFPWNMSIRGHLLSYFWPWYAWKDCLFEQNTFHTQSIQMASPSCEFCSVQYNSISCRTLFCTLGKCRHIFYFYGQSLNCCTVLSDTSESSQSINISYQIWKIKITTLRNDFSLWSIDHRNYKVLRMREWSIFIFFLKNALPLAKLMRTCFIYWWKLVNHYTPKTIVINYIKE